MADDRAVPSKSCRRATAQSTPVAVEPAPNVYHLGDAVGSGKGGGVRAACRASTVRATAAAAASATPATHARDLEDAVASGEGGGGDMRRAAHPPYGRPRPRLPPRSRGPAYARPPYGHGNPRT